MYTFTDITLTLKQLCHKTFVKDLQNCEGGASLKNICYMKANQHNYTPERTCDTESSSSAISVVSTGGKSVTAS